MADQRCRDWHYPDACLDRDHSLDSRPASVAWLAGRRTEFNSGRQMKNGPGFVA